MKKIDWDLYLITEESLSKGRKTIEIVKEAAAAGVDVVQMREKNLSLREKFQLGQKIKKVCRKYKLDFIVNDRLDLALALGADGVHLGQSDLPLKAARSIAGPEMIIGLSAWQEEEIAAAEAGGADYIGVGAVFATASKKLKSRKNGIGIKKIEALSRQTEIPLIAIGGLNKANSAQVIASGADTISVITALTGADQVALETAEFKKIIENAKNKRRNLERCQQKIIELNSTLVRNGLN